MVASHSPRLSPGFSVYLDLIRFLAALAVFIDHAELSGLTGKIPLISGLAGEAVVIFFVLSGYIIESTTNAGRGWRTYAIARAARIYSVVLPAFLLGVFVKAVYVIPAGGGQLSAFLNEDLTWWRPIVVLGFLGDLWFFSERIPWNGPIWSLNYEVFYYLLYGVITFTTGRRRVAIVTALCIIAGPKIMVLLPCWWLGVWLARRADLRFATVRAAQIALASAWAAILISNVVGVQSFIRREIISHIPGHWRLDMSQNLLSDYIVALLVAVTFVAARDLGFKKLCRATPVIRLCAGYTFSLYLFHRPFQNFASRYYQMETGSVAQSAALLILILLCVVLLGSVTEARKEPWRRMFASLIGAGRQVRYSDR